jgi:hypothetical protein
VLLSVIAHGVTAEPLAQHYGARLTPAEHRAGVTGMIPVPVRRLIRRSHAAHGADAGQNPPGPAGNGGTR